MENNKQSFLTRFKSFFKRKKKKSNTPSQKENGPKRMGKKWRYAIIIVMWIGGIFPLLALTFLFSSPESFGVKVPPIEYLDNPPEKQASIIYTSDGKEMGRFWSVNRNSVTYNEISPNIISALIATEDERYYEHAGIDPRGLARAIVKMGKDGGASTISQQLAKLLFTEVAGSWKERLYQKIGENITAVQLEHRYSKEEIITMYLNQFDFLNNAVGIQTAARVYFNTTADSLGKEQAAMLVGMCQNPSKFNPLDESKVEAVKKRREIVLNQWLKNSDNEYVPVKLTQAEYDSLRDLPLGLDYQIVDHKEGIAPYYREVLRKELQEKLAETNPDGSLKYAKDDGSEYNIYRDGLRIYTTIDSRLQAHAEWAAHKYLSETLQPEFFKNNAKWKKPPFANDMDDEQIQALITRGMKNSDRFRNMKKRGVSESEIFKSFGKERKMRVFSYDGLIDTVMTPKDSMIYYKQFLQVGMMSMDPKTGFVKAWVGGADFDHFAYDHVKYARRQVGSTFKPFVYGAALRDGVLHPCDAFPNVEYCVDYQKSPTRTDSWCPNNAGAAYTGEMTPVKCGLAASMNNITVKIMDLVKPHSVVQLAEDLGIEKGYIEPVPAIALGTMDLSVFELLGAQSALANNGLYIEPITILRVEDRNGNVIIDMELNMNQAMDPNSAYMMVQLMKNVVSGTGNPYAPGKYYGTAGRLRSSAYDYAGLRTPIAGKTGTTNGATDGWFVGLTPDLTTAVWVGADDRGIRFRNLTWGQGARMAMPIFGYYMNKVYDDKNIKISTGDFEAPEGFDQSIFNCSQYRQDMNDGNSFEKDNGWGS